MLIRLTNPVHGAMHVYSETDAIAHEKLGWVRDVPEPAVVVEAETIAEPVAEAEPVKRKYVRKVA